MDIKIAAICLRDIKVAEICLREWLSCMLAKYHIICKYLLLKAFTNPHAAPVPAPSFPSYLSWMVLRFQVLFSCKLHISVANPSFYYAVIVIFSTCSCQDSLTICFFQDRHLFRSSLSWRTSGRVPPGAFSRGRVRPMGWWGSGSTLPPPRKPCSASSLTPTTCCLHWRARIAIASTKLEVWSMSWR